MAPMLAHQKIRVMEGTRLFQEPFKHAVMVAFQADPVAPLCQATGQPVKHPTAVGPSGDVVAKENNARIGATICFDMAERPL